MARKSGSHWRQRKTETSWDPRDIVSEEELLNRVVLAKALMAYCADQTVHFRTEKEDLEITPTVARDVIREAGLKLKKNRARRPTSVPSC